MGKNNNNKLTNDALDKMIDEFKAKDAAEAKAKAKTNPDLITMENIGVKIAIGYMWRDFYDYIQYVQQQQKLAIHVTLESYYSGLVDDNVMAELLKHDKMVREKIQKSEEAQAARATQLGK